MASRQRKRPEGPSAKEPRSQSPLAYRLAVVGHLPSEHPQGTAPGISIRGVFFINAWIGSNVFSTAR
jgi:hypothetical protein